MVKAPTELRALRSQLRRCQEQLAVVERIFDEAGVDTHTRSGAKYETMGRARRLAAEVKRLRNVERGHA